MRLIDINRQKAFFVQLLYLLSGILSLALQVTWQKQMYIIFGGTIYSVAVILCAWMVGLGLGNFFGGRFADKRKNLFTIFCYTQVLTVIAVFLSPLLFIGINNIDKLLFEFQKNNLILSLFSRAFLSIAALIIPTGLIGAGLPILSGALGKNKIPKLYFINAIGSIIGALVITFFLLPLVGSLISIISISVLILVFNSAALFQLKRNISTSTKKTINVQDRKTDNTERIKIPAKKLLLILIPVVFCFSGFTSLSYELLYNRIILYLFRGTTFYSFSIIIIIFIFGLTLGAFFYNIFKKRLTTFTSKLFCFAAFELFIGFWHIMLPHYSYFISTNPVVGHIVNIVPNNFFIGGIITRILYTSSFIIPPVFAFGFIYPLVIEIFLFLKHGKNIERNVGFICLLNTSGSAIGPIVTGFCLISLFQISGSLRFISILNIILALVILVVFLFEKEYFKKRKYTLIYLGLFCVFFIGSFFVPNSFKAFEKIAQIEESNEILYYKEGVFATISVAKTPKDILTLQVNALPEVPTDHDSIRTFRLLAYLPYMIKEDAESTLCIAFGGGITFGSICQVGFIKKRRCIEICEDVLDAAHFFKEFNHEVYRTNKKDIFIDDGRRYIEKTNEKYDVIICDSTHPAEADSWALFTKEFYTACKRSLNNNGIMAQWIPIHSLPFYDYKIILRTFASTFKNVSLFFCNHYSIIIGSSNPIKISKNALSKLLNNEVIRKDLIKANLSTLKDIEYTHFLKNNDIKIFAEKGIIAKDDFTPIQFSEIRRVGKKETKLDIVENFRKYISKDHSRDKEKREYQMLTCRIHEYIYKQDFIKMLFYLDEEKNNLIRKNLFDKEIEYFFSSSKEIVHNFFFKKMYVSDFLNNPSDDKIRMVTRLSKIMENDYDFETLKAILYFKMNRLNKALDLFITLLNIKSNPEFYNYIVAIFQKQGKNVEAEKYKQEARQKYNLFK